MYMNKLQASTYEYKTHAKSTIEYAHQTIKLVYISSKQTNASWQYWLKSQARFMRIPYWLKSPARFKRIPNPILAPCCYTLFRLHDAQYYDALES